MKLPLIPVLRIVADRLCDKLAEQENESPDALWEFFITASQVPLKYRKPDGEFDPVAAEFWDAIQQLKDAELAELKGLLP
jgi:hypothetical protein